MKVKRSEFDCPYEPGRPTLAGMFILVVRLVPTGTTMGIDSMGLDS